MRWRLFFVFSGLGSALIAAACSSSTSVTNNVIGSDGGADSGRASAAENDAAPADGGADDAEAGLPPGYCGLATGKRSDGCHFTERCDCTSAGPSFQVECLDAGGGVWPGIEGCAAFGENGQATAWCCPPGCVREPNFDTGICAFSAPKNDAGPHAYLCNALDGGELASPKQSGCVRAERGPNGDGSGPYHVTYCCP